MNRSKALSYFSLVLLGVLLVGCRTAPVYNVEEAPIATASGGAVELEQVRRVILDSGSGLGWQMKDAAPGHLVATLFLRSHMAQVDIKYTTSAYSITYKDSQDLDYDGTVIHSNYNGWVQRLDNAIRARLTAL